MLASARFVSLRRNVPQGALALLLGAAVLLRVLDFLPHRSLWLDEAMLGFNIQQFGFARLMGPLVMDQASPIGFLWLQRLTYLLLEPADLFMRVWPLVFGVSSLLIMHRLARCYGDGSYAWLATALLAFSPVHLRFSSELKPYTLDVLAAATLLWLFTRVLQDPQNSKRLLHLTLAGALAIWWSFPVLFVLAGIGVGGITARLWERRQLHDCLPWIYVGAAWFASFAPLYWFNIRLAETNPDLQAYWHPHFAPLPKLATLPWYSSHFLKNAEYLFYTQLKWLAIGVMGAGLVSLFIRQKALAIAIVTTLAATLLASHRMLYPFYGRLLVFMMPSAALLMAEGVERLRQAAGRLHPSAKHIFFGAVVVGMLWSPISVDIKSLQIRAPVTGMKPLARSLRSRYQAGDQLYVYYGAVPEYSFYQSQFEFRPEQVVLGERHRGEPQAYVAEMDARLGSGRVWVLFSHGCCAKFDERGFILDHLSVRGVMLERVDSAGATAYLYQLDRPGQQPGQHP